MALRPPLVIAHRGASAYAPGNSLAAFALAVELGADGVELDVRLAPDGTLAVVHDPLPLPPGAAAPPTLAQALDLLAGNVVLDLELKELAPADAAIDLVRARMDAADVVVTSFLPEAVARTRERWPEVAAGLLLHHRIAPDAGTALAAARACGATAVAVDLPMIERDGPAWAADAGLDVYVWTVNDRPTLGRLLADPAVRGVITDVPDVARDVRT